MATCQSCGADFTSRNPQTRFCSQSCVNRCRRQPTFEERFWRMVDRRGPNECWPWRKPHPGTGYGRLKWRDGRQHPAHRIAYELTYGWMSEAAVCCHACDNRACCNPRHLWLGTTADNNADRDRKGRQQRGERHHAAKLTEHDVRAVRDSSASHSELARLYSVSVSTIANIRTRKKWRSVA